MSTQKHSGFTIIEVMLFVAISAVVTTAALVGWSTNINTQSYRDSARSLASALGQQYTNTLNVSNDRANDQTCNNSNIAQSNPGTPIGQTDCVLMGRYIVMKGTKLAMSNIIGSGSSASGNDMSAIAAYSPVADTASGSSYSIPWSSRPYPSKDNKAATLNVAIAIVRSPVSGTVYTFVKPFNADSDSPRVADIIDSANQQKMTICLDPESTVVGGTQAVVVNQYAASSSAINVEAGNTSC